MSKTPRIFIKSILFLIFLLPIFVQAQSSEAEVEALQRKVDELSKMLTELKSEQSQSDKVGVELEKPRQSDKQRIKALHRKQAASRARIDAITQEIINLSKQLEDPRKRFALAKRMQKPPTPKQPALVADEADISSLPEIISARSIDLSAVKLVRKGKSLDQARLLTIDELSADQVLSFYRGLAKDDRHELYDIADEIVESENIDLGDARRSAIYFFLFAK